MTFEIPGSGQLEIKTIVLDLNGTLSVGGQIVAGVEERLIKLKELGFKIVFFSGDTRGDASQITKELGIDFKKASNASEKAALAKSMDPDTCASIGNGLIDLELTQVVKLGIVTLQAEGIHTQTLFAADIIVPTINDALDLFLDQSRLIATLRK